MTWARAELASRPILMDGELHGTPDIPSMVLVRSSNAGGRDRVAEAEGIGHRGMPRVWAGVFLCRMVVLPLPTRPSGAVIWIGA